LDIQSHNKIISLEVGNNMSLLCLDKIVSVNAKYFFEKPDSFIN
jgi:hypothetical protein